MGKPTETGQFVVLPPHGLRARDATTTGKAQDFLRKAHDGTGTQGLSIDGRRVPMRVVDSLGPDGAKLVELTADSALAMRALRPDLRVVPLLWYTPAFVPPRQVESPAAPARKAAASDTVTLKVVSKEGGAPVANAFVVAFLDYAGNVGAQGTTAADGKVSLVLGGASVKLDRLYVYPLDAHWSLVKKRFTVSSGDKITLNPLDLGYTDGLRYFYPAAADSAGAGVTVGVVDTGVAPHPDLVIAGGANTVPGEDPKDYGDNGKAHGTHVAGIIAARGRPPTGLRGVAPA